MNRISITLTCIITFILISIQTDSLGQPTIEWQNTIGGNADDILQCSAKTSDGGLILAGGSTSGISGDKTENSSYYDFWVVKLDSLGNIQWQNTFGGTGEDIANSIQQNLDGSYIVAGYSGSGISGDKTEPLIGVYDIWVVKLDATGNIVWQNTIGGNDNDEAVCIRQTSDLGYIIAAFSLSGISGDKTEPNLGPSYTSDYWVIKLNSSGSIVWQNTIGGNYYDYVYAIEQSWDGGYIVGGYSQSGISGDKSEALIGASDFWVLKLNSSGNIQWQNTIGGTGSESVRRILLAADGGYVLAGFSSSDITGDKTEIAYGLGNDYWIVKINSTGSLVWQNDIGGNEDDILLYADNTSDGGYILGGISYSGASGDKTEPGLGNGDYWVVKVNSTGIMEWQNTIGGSLADQCESVVETTNGGYAVSGFSRSGISGDKTENNMGPLTTYDYWVVKLFGNCIPTAEVCNSFDDNCNGVIDDGIVETISITADGPTIFCQGSSVTLQAIYSGTTVQWKRNGVNIAGATSSSFVANQKGSYSCETTSACGSAISSILNVVVNKNPSASITPGGPITFCTGGSVTLTEAPVAGCSYQWYKGASPLAGETATTYVATTTGNYKCRVTKMATGCYKNSNTISVSVPCKEGLNQDWPGLEDSKVFSVYPNPNDGTFTISENPATLQSLLASPADGRETRIYNSVGQIIYSEQFTSSETEFIKTISIKNITPEFILFS